MEIAAGQNNFRPVAFRRFDLGNAGVFRHKDRGRDAEKPGGQRDALRVVSGACGGDAPYPFVRRKQGQPVVRAAYLKRPGALLILALQHNVRAQPNAPGNAVARNNRRVMRRRLHPRQGGFNCGKRDVHGSYNTETVKKSQGESTQAALPVDLRR